MALLLAVAPAACTGLTWESVRDSSDPETLRRYLDDNPQDPNFDEINRRIEQLEYRRARQANTVYAWRLFISRYPGSPLALDARRQLERLQFELARKQGSQQSWREFLRWWPRGSLADEARRRLSQLECRQLAGCTDENTLAHALRRSLPCHQQLAARLEQLRFRAAIGKGSRLGLYGFLESYPRGRYSRQVRRRLLEQLVAALLRAARFDQALERVRSSGLPAEDLVERIERARRWGRLTEFVDIRPAGDGKEPARSWSEELRRHRRWYERLARATRRLRRHARQLPEPDWEDGSGKARQRWLLADRLGAGCDEHAADRLLQLAGDSYLEVRRRARHALRRLLDTLGPDRSMAWLHDRIMDIRGKAVGGVLLYRLALLQYLQGREAEALASLQKIIEQEGAEPSLLLLGVGLARRLGQPRQAALLARDFTRVAREFFEHRRRAWQDEGLRNRSSGANTLWQLYGLVRTWREVLESFPPSAAGPADDYRVVLGDWLADSRSGLAQVTGWLARAQRWWSTRHPSWIPCETEPVPSPGPSRLDLRALLEIALLPRGPTAATLQWVRCCHPGAGLRQTAGLLSGQARLLREAGLVVPVWQLLGSASRTADGAAPGQAGKGNGG